jgi:hypothetical protein
MSESGTLEQIAHLERCIEVNEIEIEGLKKDIQEQHKKIEAMSYDSKHSVLKLRGFR